MSIPITRKTKKGFHLTSSENYLAHAFTNVLFFLTDIFYPLGELISPHLLRCAPFVVDDHNFMGQRLASAAISTREQYKFDSKGVDTNN
jgi:hypothetical protein